MTNFQIKVVNEEFVATSEQELADPEAANAHALMSALEVGSEQILAGKPFFAAEVTVSGGNYRQRFVVAMGVSALK